MTSRGWFLFASMCVLWGIPYLLIKVAVAGVQPPVVVFARTLIGAILLLPFAFRGGPPTWLRRHWKPLLAFTVLEIMGPWWLLSSAEQQLTSSTTGLLVAATPIIAVLAARERPTLARLIGLVTGFGGVALLAAPELTGGSPWAIAQVLLTAVCYATAPMIVARSMSDVPSLPMTAVCLTVAAIVYAPLAALTWPDRVPSVQVLGALLALGAVCTGLAMAMFFALIREIGPTRAVVIAFVNPAVALAAGVAILGEPLTTSIVVGFVAILVGSALATVTGRRVAEPAVVAAQPDP